MTAAQRDLHGVLLEVEDRLASQPTGPLLDPFPAPRHAGGPGAIRLRLVPAAAARAAPAGRPLFFHGELRAFGADGRTILWDGRSTLTVAADGAAVDGEIHAASIADPHAFAHGPLLMALLAALRHHGRFHLHAAGLRSPAGEGVLVAANGGCGKSTVALALASAGWDFLGDDTVLLGPGARGPRLLALPRAFHVGAATAAAFPRLAPFLGAPYGETGKRFLDAERAFGRAALREAAAPAAILFPSITGARATTVAPLAPADVLGRLIEASALVVVDGAAGVGAQLALLKAVADGGRGWAVALGRDLLEDPGAWVGATARAIGLGRA